jgi:hypothetical protein
MPVVKLEFECPEDLDKAIKTEIIILEGKKEIVLERKRNSKIVQCFNCNRFGHRASVKMLLRQPCTLMEEEEEALASHKEGVTTVEVKIVRIVIAQKQVNVQTVKDNIKFLRQTVLYSRNSKTKDKSTILQTSSSDSQNENSFH